MHTMMTMPLNCSSKKTTLEMSHSYRASCILKHMTIYFHLRPKTPHGCNYQWKSREMASERTDLHSALGAGSKNIDKTPHGLSCLNNNNAHFSRKPARYLPLTQW